MKLQFPVFILLSNEAFDFKWYTRFIDLHKILKKITRKYCFEKLVFREEDFRGNDF